MTEPTLHSIQRAFTRTQLDEAFVTLDWDENSAVYTIRVGAIGTKSHLLSAIDKVRMELDTMYALVKQDILNERVLDSK